MRNMIAILTRPTRAIIRVGSTMVQARVAYLHGHRVDPREHAKSE